MTDLTDQLRDLLAQRLAQPLRTLLGADDLAEQVEARIDTHTHVIAAQLQQDDDDRLAVQTVIDLLTALWPDADPPPDWWRTPAGRLCARSLGHADAEAVTYSVAAAMLGVAPGTVSQLAHRGTLDKHPDGGLTRASVLLRIGRSMPGSGPP